MSRDISPQDTLTTRNGGSTVTDGNCLPPHNQPQPTDGDWTPFDSISQVASWICLAAFVVSLVLLCASLTIFFFL